LGDDGKAAVMDYLRRANQAVPAITMTPAKMTPIAIVMSTGINTYLPPLFSNEAREN
jgi:hypothetical protein